MRISKLTFWAAVVSVVVGAGCGGVGERKVTSADLAVIKASFKAKGQAGLDRLDQDDAQRFCSDPSPQSLSSDEAIAIRQQNFVDIKYPGDGGLMGDWRQGERIAQSGVGKQFSDSANLPSGGNCYACHQLSKAEISYGTIGPSLYNYGKLRGTSEPTQRYVFGRIYNSQAFNLCSNMPRFGHNGILSEQQLKDVTALLLDPQSPVNQ